MKLKFKSEFLRFEKITELQISRPAREKTKSDIKNRDVIGVAQIDALQFGKKIILISHNVIFLETKMSTRFKTLI